MYPALIHDAAVGVDVCDSPVGVHAAGERGREQRKTLAPAQQHIQIVVEVVMEPA